MHALTPSASAKLAAAAASRAVIDFLEELVVLPDHLVLGIELQRAFIGLARLVELNLFIVK